MPQEHLGSLQAEFPTNLGPYQMAELVRVPSANTGLLTGPPDRVQVSVRTVGVRGGPLGRELATASLAGLDRRLPRSSHSQPLLLPHAPGAEDGVIESDLGEERGEHCLGPRAERDQLR